MGKRKEMQAKRQKTVQPVTIRKKKKRPAYLATWSVPRRPWKNLDYFDNNTGNLVPPTNAQTWRGPVLINAIAQGIDPNQYIGRDLMMKSLQFRFSFNPNDGGTSTNGGGSFLLRFMLIYVKDTSFNAAGNAELPLVTDVFNTDNFGSYMQLNFVQNIAVLYDKVKRCNPDCVANGVTQTASGNGPNCPLWFTKKIKLQHLQRFQAATASINSITSGAIYALVSQNGNWNSASSIPSVYFWSRIRYQDD